MCFFARYLWYNKHHQQLDTAFSVNLTIDPGFVYIFHSKNRPDDVKIGFTKCVETREFTLKLADPDLTVYEQKFFLNAKAAEEHMHNFFNERRIVREHFKVLRADAAAELNRLFTAHQEEFQKFKTACRSMVDFGQLNLDCSDQVLECNGSALSVVLSHIPDAKDGRNVKTLIPLALDGGLSASLASKLLRQCGLVPYPAEAIVIFDKTSAKLSRIFNKKTCAKTWEKQLSKYAGLNEKTQAVNLKAWLDVTDASPELVDAASPPVKTNVGDSKAVVVLNGIR